MKLSVWTAKSIIIAALCNVLSVHAAELPPALQKSLASRQVDGVKLEKGSLYMTIRKPVVRREAFDNVLTFGACWTANTWGRSDIRRIEIRNDIGAQGFSFQGGRNECEALKNIALDAEKRTSYISERLWVCVAGNACRPRRPGEVTAGDE
ncbi:hypothetical protein [Paraburkholderia phenoliruptrix]|uniref:hypothetical protein n=1 Tax=Paraburkholderia phenoliruptrix TaxID=252970 RepID=UPI002858A903|nr:hypothetical protein [Paraburkholderia phenoliruptrix]MDR6387587.1 hypothetical protein [Paraburkholderia phenoliruptrix]